jgi:hypothetical protein
MVAVQMVLAPRVKATVPVGVPLSVAGATVAE